MFEFQDILRPEGEAFNSIGKCFVVELQMP